MRKRRAVALAIGGILLAVLVVLAVLVKFDERVEARGIVEPYDFIAIRAPMSLLLKDILCEEYEYVEAGQKLAVLEDSELRHGVASARDEVDRAKATFEGAAAQLRNLESSPRPEELRVARERAEQARLKLRVQENRLQRIQELYAKSYVSQEELEEAKMQSQIAESEHTEAQTMLEMVQRGASPEELAASRAQVKEAQAAYEQAQQALAAAEERLRETVLTAPSAGVVSKISTREGTMLNAGDMVMIIAGGEEKLLRVWVREADAVKVRPGQSVVIESQLYRQRRDWSDGEVIKIYPYGESKRGLQHYEVKIRITREPAPLKLGSSAWASVLVGRRTVLDMIRGTGERFGSTSSRGDR